MSIKKMKRKLEDHKKSDYESMASFKNLFQRHKQMRQLFDWDRYHDIFGDLVYNEIDINCYYPPIYDIYFDDANVDSNIINNDTNGSDDIIDEVFVNKIEVE